MGVWQPLFKVLSGFTQFFSTECELALVKISLMCGRMKRFFSILTILLAFSLPACLPVSTRADFHLFSQVVAVSVRKEFSDAAAFAYASRPPPWCAHDFLSGQAMDR